jgi:Ribbon-helix-helix protein, copG family
MAAVVQPTLVKVSFELPDDEYQQIMQLAQRQGISITKAIRQAIQTEVFMDQMTRDGFKVVVEGNGARTELSFG